MLKPITTPGQSATVYKLPSGNYVIVAKKLTPQQTAKQGIHHGWHQVAIEVRPSVLREFAEVEFSCRRESFWHKFWRRCGIEPVWY